MNGSVEKLKKKKRDDDDDDGKMIEKNFKFIAMYEVIYHRSRIYEWNYRNL